jgi:hypothetical protein
LSVMQTRTPGSRDGLLPYTGRVTFPSSIDPIRFWSDMVSVSSMSLPRPSHLICLT